MSNEKKEGIELILDLASALQARIAHARTTTLVPPADAGDQRLADVLGHWEQLAKNIAVEATSLKLKIQYQPLTTLYAAIDRISALMALPADTSPAKIADAVKTAVTRLQELEVKIVEYREARTPPARPPIRASSPPHIQLIERLAGTNDDDEPRASYVMERLEGLVLGGWLGDAVANLERVAEYMRANEARMSEDVFDELGRIAMKLSGWADEILRGNMFPRD